MKNYSHIEKSAFHKDQYVGYGHGKVWIIKRHERGWIATHQDGSAGSVSARTLEILNTFLEGDLTSSEM